MSRAHVICGDMREELARLPADAFGSIVTDPPYGLSFMSAGWDHDVPGPEHWRAALRVAKPGAHLVAFGGTRTFHRLTCAIEDAGWEVRDCLSWLYGTGFPKSHNGAWGGTALKPAWEPIILARKPLAGTIAATFAAHGTGGLSVDGCRTDTAPDVPGSANIRAQNDRAMGAGWDASAARRAAAYRENPPSGRWPANVVLDEEAAEALDEQSGVLTSGKLGPHHKLRASTNVAMSGPNQERSPRQSFGGDTGGASRFFYCAKSSRRERGSTNDHPTVKPLALMRWLVRLVAPPGTVVLDPFAGSGSTLLAAVAEGREALGVELDPHHVDIIRDRLQGAP